MHALSAESLQTWAILLSTGVDPFRTIIVQQSRVPELIELMWILGTATTLPSLTGLSQFKDKSKSLKAVPVGLATYHEKGYHPSHVLVGFDQNCSNAHWKLFVGGKSSRPRKLASVTPEKEATRVAAAVKKPTTIPSPPKTQVGKKTKANTEETTTT
uniref:Uncharacterized protein n=1 Tax=Meloidogyne javanica TaxID=6303 RepID=A0A915LFF2_MELJA